jgi:nucleoside-diphosphate-sugar epimerase
LARALIVGCGCHGRELAAELAGLGWQVRGTSRDPAGVDAIDAAGVEAVAADPNRPGSVLDLCRDVAVVVWLLGCAAGEPEALSAIHGPRLERLLEKLVDSAVRGFAYEAAGSVGRETLARGAAIVERAGETWRLPVAVLSEDRREPGWATRSAVAIAELLTA